MTALLFHVIRDGQRAFPSDFTRAGGSHAIIGHISGTHLPLEREEVTETSRRMEILWASWQCCAPWLLQLFLRVWGWLSVLPLRLLFRLAFKSGGWFLVTERYLTNPPCLWPISVVFEWSEWFTSLTHFQLILLLFSEISPNKQAGVISPVTWI